MLVIEYLYVALDCKTSVLAVAKIVSVKMIDFCFVRKIISILSKDHLPSRHLVNVLL